MVTADMYTGPKEFVHLHAHTQHSILDGVGTASQYAERCYKEGLPGMAATEHGHMGSVPDMYLEFRKYGLKYVTGCFLPSQPLLTLFGVKRFEELTLDDAVITARNRARRINNIQIRDYDGEVIRVKAWGVEEIVATPEHPFLIREVIREETKKGCWSENITINMRQIGEVYRQKYHRTYSTKRSKDRTNKRRYRFYLCVPRLPDSDGIKFLDLTQWLTTDINAQFTIKDSVIIKVQDRNALGMIVDRPVNLPERIEIDEELLWIMGLWLAEGTARHGQLSFWLGADEFDFYLKIKNYFSKYDITTSYHFRKDRQALDVIVYSTSFATIFANIFNKGFANKRIPWWLITDLNKTQTETLLNGVFDGDAKLSDKQSYLKLCNESLVWQIRLLMTRLGQYSAITPIRNNNSDNIGYSLRRRESGHFYYDYDTQYIYLPVCDVYKEHYQGKVYNIEVNEDNTYNVGAAVHNCEIYFNEFEPERQRLVAAGEKLRSAGWRDDPANAEKAARIFRNRHLTVLCKNETGFHNLIKLTTQAYATGLFGAGRRQFNRIWFDKLCEFKEGLIILSGCLNGPVAHELFAKEVKDRKQNVIRERTAKEQLEAAVSWIKRFKQAFGEDYYIELQMPGIPGDDKVFRNLVMMADKFKIKTALTNDCWNSNTPVLTQRGAIKFPDLKVGDFAWTHKGRLNEITRIGKRPLRVDENIYGLGGFDDIFCTDHHKVLSSRNGIKKKRRVSELTDSDYVCVGRIKLPFEPLKEIRLSDYLDDTRCRIDENGLVYPRGNAKHPISDNHKITDELLWLIGFYIAEGSVDSYRLSFATHRCESSFRIRVRQFFENFGLKPTDYHSKTCLGSYTRICCSSFTYFLQSVCGDHAHTKKLPSFWTSLNKQQLLQLLRGYYDGDGFKRDGDGSSLTTSFQLCVEMLHAYASVGILATPGFRKERHVIIKKKDGRRIKTFHRRGYYIRIGKSGKKKLGYIKNYDDSKSRKIGFIDADGSWIPNPFKLILWRACDVWDIRVENDHTYLMGVTSSNCHYLQRKDFQLQKIMMAIAQGVHVNSPELFHVNSDEQYLKTRAELWERFKNNSYSQGIDDGVFEAACDNTLLIADQCKPFKIDDSIKIPEFTDADSQLRVAVAKRLHELGFDKCKQKFLIDGNEVTYVEQARIELKRITDKGFSSYFLIIQDLVAHGKNNGWPFSPRGSASGSLVCYLLGIHSINPLLWGLSFDRFLSPARGGYLLNVKME